MSRPSDLKFAIICSSNMNRSMEAHAYLSKKNYLVQSFGTGDKVKLPGTSVDRPNCYEFGVSYEDIYNDLLSKDKQYYKQSGLLHMIERNKRIKMCPQRFQDSKEVFDVIVTCEERVYDQLIEYMESRKSMNHSIVHVINVDIQDNHEEATLGAFLIGDLVQMIAKSEDLDNDIDDLLHDFEIKCQRRVLHSVLVY